MAIGTRAFVSACHGHNEKSTEVIERSIAEGLVYLDEIISLESEKKIEIYAATLRAIEALKHLLNEQ